MKRFHEIISTLPYVIVGYCLLFYIIGTLGFYHKYFELLDLIDFVPVCLCVFHFILNLIYKWVDYSQVKIVLICAIIMISAMYKLRDSVSDVIYWNLYLSTLIGGIVMAIFTYFITRRK